jgi:Protein of unknown function (DUF3618)
MSNDTTARLNGATPQDPAELKAEIARTRADLGETASALAAKTDVKARLRAQAASLSGTVREQARTTAGTLRTRTMSTVSQVRSDPAQLVRRPVPVAVVAAVTSAAAVAVVLIRRSRR